jgi:hypothetical protein
VTDSFQSLAQELRFQASEAIRISNLVPDGTKAALVKLAADLLAQATELEAKAVAVVVTPLVTDAKPSDET